MEGQYWIIEGESHCEGQPYRGYGIGYRVVDDGGHCYEGEIGDISTDPGEVEGLLLRIGKEPLTPENLQAVVEDYLAEVTSVFLA